MPGTSPGMTARWGRRGCPQRRREARLRRLARARRLLGDWTPSPATRHVILQRESHGRTAAAVSVRARALALSVMAGLVPAIHVLRSCSQNEPRFRCGPMKDVDARDKPG